MSWYAALKDATAAAKRINDAELLEAIADLRMEGVELTEENVRLREEVLELKGQLSLKDELDFEKNLYWRKIPDGNEGPFCPRCYPEKGQAVPMVAERGEYITDFYKCPVCETMIDDEDGTPKKPTAGIRLDRA